MFGADRASLEIVYNSCIYARPVHCFSGLATTSSPLPGVQHGGQQGFD